MAEIKYVGFDDLHIDVAQRSEIESAVDKDAETVQRLINNELELVVHLKEYSHEGEKHKYSLHIRAAYPGGTFVSDKAHGWDVVAVVKQGMKALAHQVQARFR